MRFPALSLALLAVAAAHGQTVDQVYNRDTHDPFKLKNVKIESTVVGPIVRTSTVLTYDNPYKALTEASLNFTLPEAAALSGFAYFYGDEYVKGQLMDKAKAWFIYTAITSRNEDPGIMDQWSPTQYHCQIYPIKAGSDLRVRLYTVAFLKPSGDQLQIPAPDVPVTATYSDRGETAENRDWTVRAVHSAPAVRLGADYTLPMPTGPIRAVSQKFKDGRVYVAGLMRADSNNFNEPSEPTFAVLRQPKFVDLGQNTIAFMGWLPRAKKIAVRYNGTRAAFRPEKIDSGSEAARLWAQQMLATGSWRHHRDVVRFSLKYGVPSTATALLAVPQEQMKLFSEKEKAWQKQQAEQRREQLAEARRERNWSGSRNQNWNAGGGGDPEIRVIIPGAKSVQAILPDRRIIDLKPDGDVWGGNFEIPAKVPEGLYNVRVIAKFADGTTAEQHWTYKVDRTAPLGKAAFQVKAGRLLLVVHSESGLAEVAAYDATGRKWVLKEVTPGVYQAEVPTGSSLRLRVVMKDRAGNKGELLCSWR